MENKQRKAAQISAVVYTLISSITALAFFAAASAQGRYSPAEIYGGTAWVFLLSMIITMPLVMPWMKKRLKA